MAEVAEAAASVEAECHQFLSATSAEQRSALWAVAAAKLILGPRGLSCDAIMLAV